LRAQEGDRRGEVLRSGGAHGPRDAGAAEGKPGDRQRRHNDFERAKRNIQRALALDDAYMPAYNQLALYYLALAKQRAPAAPSRQAGERERARARGAGVLAGDRKDPRFAPIHNTAGLYLD
jgi:hypothetical protein